MSYEAMIRSISEAKTRSACRGMWWGYETASDTAPATSMLSMNMRNGDATLQDKRRAQESALDLLDGMERSEAVSAAVASARIEGLAVSEQAQVTLDEFASGAISDREMVARVLALHIAGG